MDHTSISRVLTILHDPIFVVQLIQYSVYGRFNKNVLFSTNAGIKFLSNACYISERQATVKAFLERVLQMQNYKLPKKEYDELLLSKDQKSEIHSKLSVYIDPLVFFSWYNDTLLIQAYQWDTQKHLFFVTLHADVKQQWREVFTIVSICAVF